MRDFHIVYISDENYAMPTCVSIVSLKITCEKPANYHIYVLADGISAGARKKLLSVSEEWFEIHILDVENDRYREMADTCLNKGTYVTYCALFKFDIANILKNIDKALYLDGDTLVNKDISELFDIDMSEAYVAAVDDMGDKYVDGRSSLAARIRLRDQKYFNSGVLLLNLQKMRRDKVSDQLLKYRLEQTNYFVDQDAINSVMGQKRISLPYCYNFRTALFDTMEIEEISNRFFEGRYTEIKSCLEDQSVIHMSDRLKPWKYNFPWVTDLFLRFYRESPYKKESISFLSPLKAMNDRNYEKNQRINQIMNEKVWKFPYHKVKKGSKVILYGAGKVGYDFYGQITESEFCQVVLWVDKFYMDKADNIVSPEKIQDYEYDYVVIALSNETIMKEAERYLYSLGMKEDKIVTIK